ncbi:hypothetical protein BD626DRAFT_500604 [Schizophyllum amplum]|uniref:PhoD-like phosphatase domain-containing protein n=1 Tax=Schizophyllum amplum TaxID=97359 RepID=A0A550CAI2_9AGAR|nr:hypothetical protein BD626DRAFT_500604 [Auriculariopsis ampla]
MDDPGFHARRRAAKEEEHLRHPQRGHDGRWMPVEQVTPMDESFIGGFYPHIPAGPPVPSKDQYRKTSEGDRRTQTSVTSSQMTNMSAVERSKMFRVARMEPHLQFMVGPLLRYDTVDTNGTWHGAALVVTADAGSIYSPHPTLTYEWDPENVASSQRKKHRRGGANQSFDLGPHPADPHSTAIPTVTASGMPENGNGHSTKKVEESPGQEIHVHGGEGGTFTFWRFMIHIPLSDHEMAITYTINRGQALHFFVPGRNQNMRMAVHSCNGFSAGVNPDDFRGPGFKSGYDPVWVDLLNKHAEEPFHVLTGGGDQIYCDSLTREPELQDWVTKTKPEERKAYPLTDEIREAIDRFFFNHYCQQFRSGAFARANCSIPMLNMADDHDLIDGFGSYPDDMQRAPVFQTIGSRGYFYYLLFQLFVNPEVDGLDDTPGAHVNQSIIFGEHGPYIPYPSHSFLSWLGPQVQILMLDCRAERMKDRVCSSEEYQKVFERLQHIPPTTEHLIVQLGIPIAYPRMVFLEAALESKFNPLVALGRSGSMGLTSFVNKFNADAELLDDLNDHWTATAHKKERNWLIEQLQKIAVAKKIRISFVSGDVHCAAVGVFKTLKGKNTKALPPLADPKFMLNVTTSAIVNTPPPPAVIRLVSSLASKTHKTLHHADTDETMVPVFEREPDGSSRGQRFIMGRRNYCQVDWDRSSGDIVFSIQVEKEKGAGQTVSYIVRAPPPRW